MESKIFIFFIFIILLLPGISRSQCYTVLSVKGEIVLEKTGQPIREMDEICASDKLIFSSKDSKAAVLSPEQGRYVIKLTEKKKTNELIAFVKSVITPGKEVLSTKGMESLEDEFGDNYFVVDVSKILIDKMDFPMNEKRFFYIQYSYEGKDIHKKLKFDKDTLFISDDVYKIDGQNISQDKIEKVSLYYFDEEKNTSSKIVSFNLSFADESILKNEISGYISILKTAGKADSYIIQEVRLYINDLYGNVNEGSLKSWLNLNFGVK